VACEKIDRVFLVITEEGYYVVRAVKNNNFMSVKKLYVEIYEKSKENVMKSNEEKDSNKIEERMLVILKKEFSMFL